MTRADSWGLALAAAISAGKLSGCLPFMAAYRQPASHQGHYLPTLLDQVAMRTGSGRIRGCQANLGDD